MTSQNHLDELKKLRDETFGELREGFIGDIISDDVPLRTPAQIAALNRLIKREESLADTEGHAAVLQDIRDFFLNTRSKGEILALEVGALALTERPALIAEAKQTADVLREVLAWNDKYPNTRWYSQAECIHMGKELDAICERGRLALKESHHE